MINKPFDKFPKDRICPYLIFLSKFLKKDFKKTLADNDLFSGQDHILLIVSNNEGIIPSEIAKTLGVSLATISVSIKRLEKAGFLYKKPDDNDARISRLYVTDKAKNIEATINKRIKEQEEIITSSLNKEEQETLMKLLKKITDDVRQKEGFLYEK